MRVFSVFAPATRRSALLTAAVMFLLIAFVDWRVASDIPLGFLYLFPMLVVGSSLNGWEITAFAAGCTFLAEVFDEFVWTVETGLPRDILYFAAFAGVGFVMYELTRSRRLSAAQMLQLESEMALRREAEEQLKILVESSPAAILTVSREGRILLANDAAHRLFGLEPGQLPGLPVRDYLPSLTKVPAPEGKHQPFRTAMQCQGRRVDGEVFQADVWFSTYVTSVGPRLAAMVLDTSDDLRTREESNFHQLLMSSRILVAAVSHEVRNVCGAIALVHENLTRGGQLAENKDFEALGTLVLALERIAAIDLQQATSEAVGIAVPPLLDELRIIIESSLRESGVVVRWQVEENLPSVWADRQSLMQVFLNLTKNSQRAMEESGRRRLTIGARREGVGAAIYFSDTGGGVAHPERLFRPFQQEAQATGLGLYLSRALVRSFHGELRYEPGMDGATFVVTLSPALQESEDENDDQRDPDPVGGRPQPFPGEPEPAASDRA